MTTLSIPAFSRKLVAPIRTRAGGNESHATSRVPKVDALSTATSVRPVTINAAFLREIKEDNQELRSQLADLHRRFRQPLEPDECRPMIDRLYPLLDVLAMHFALEEAYGYFDDPLDVAPQFSDRVNRLRQQHQELYVALRNLIDWAEKLYAAKRQRRFVQPLLQNSLGPRFLSFERRLRRHESEETALICEAYATDLGVGD